jgi:hypothetical protein
MQGESTDITEQIQRLVVSLIATHPAGAGLRLVGGFRYRLLDRGVRRSVDIDYHWEGDLAAKQRELVALCERRLLPDVRRQLGLDGGVAAAPRVGQESTAVASVELAFWKLGSALGRIEIPIDVTRIECVDPPVARTVAGIVYRTASDADMVESKVISILMRTFLEHRDLLDLDLFASHLPADAADRIRTKLTRLGVAEQTVARRLDDLSGAADRHARALDAVIREQLDAAAATTLVECGGGRVVLERVRGLLAGLLDPQGGAA